MNCPLCDSAGSKELFSDEIRSYRHCGKCGLIFVPVSGHVTFKAEKERYDFHRNNPGHEGYVRFLNELVSVIMKQCPCPCRILDYGSGKEAVLTRLLKERGYDSTAYDPLYNIGKDALLSTYDAIVLCEVVEHLRDLDREISTIRKAAGEKGKVVIRTRLYPSAKGFAGWWYKNDITHVNFFSRRTMAHCAAMLGREKVRQHGTDIFIIAP
ncbi:MAG: class I SAM-dependent methyltransferase [Chitinispirillaceae bacterium]|nr:class I SAM-dependent methyltransferase [Chitinispirillaceae bacterium]